MFRWPTELQQLPEAIWQRLSNACGDITNPLRLPALATVSGVAPAIRTVVLRNADSYQRTLTFFSDSRAQKIAELAAKPQIAFLFFDPRDQIQIRASGVATIHRMDAVSVSEWNQLPDSSRLNYSTEMAPGTPIPTPDQNPTDTSGRAHFAVVIANIQHIDWLQLSSPFHHRAEFVFESGQWRGRWIAP